MPAGIFHRSNSWAPAGNGLGHREINEVAPSAWSHGWVEMRRHLGIHTVYDGRFRASPASPNGPLKSWRFPAGPRFRYVSTPLRSVPTSLHRDPAGNPTYPCGWASFSLTRNSTMALYADGLGKYRGGVPAVLERKCTANGSRRFKARRNG